MKNLEQFQKFGRKDTLNPNEITKNCVVYTRVSSKEQEDNFSLPVQLKACNEFVSRYSYDVLGYFGGSHESAKSDVERKEFNRMLNFIKKSKERISYIIVYKLDRFSRTGPNAISIKDQLQQKGIHILSVTEASDPTTVSGVFQQDIQLVVSKFDNAQRRERTIIGMKERLLNGYWCGRPPQGFDILYKGSEQSIVPNEEGKLIKKAFEWKAYEGLSNMEIVNRLRKLGLKIYKQQLTKIFRNPFYCGLMSHKMLNGEVVKGKHQALITEALFLEVNKEEKKSTQGWKVNIEDENIPLKKFFKCEICNSNMRGYIVRKKNIYYYKCGTIGCGYNINAKQVHSHFKQLLTHYTLPKEYIPIVREQLEKTFEEIHETNFDNEKLLKTQLTELTKKIERLEERYVEEEINKELYDKYHLKYKKEKKGDYRPARRFRDKNVEPERFYGNLSQNSL